MSISHRWHTSIAAIITAALVAACGGGGGGGGSVVGNGCQIPAAPANPIPATPLGPGLPAVTGSVSADGLNWINYRRAQAGLSMLSRNALIDAAGQHHSDYQRANNTVVHEEITGKCGFTGETPKERLSSAGYTFGGSYAYGEVISASTSSSGQFLAEELITAIYHRFVIFEPKFKEIGAGSANNGNYYYFTTNFTANNGFGNGLGAGQVATWPVDGQSSVTPNFFSDFESPDPVAGINEVGYPVSVHADINVTLSVGSFTMRPRGGANLNVKLLAYNAVTEPHTPTSAAAIVPLTVLARATTYDVSFSGSGNGIPITRNWSFTTSP